MDEPRTAIDLLGLVAQRAHEQAVMQNEGKVDDDSWQYVASCVTYIALSQYQRKMRRAVGLAVILGIGIGVACGRVFR
jgi:hypothetical protein